VILLPLLPKESGVKNPLSVVKLSATLEETSILPLALSLGTKKLARKVGDAESLRI
jgi:hypothetical protein